MLKHSLRRNVACGAALAIAAGCLGAAGSAALGSSIRPPAGSSTKLQSTGYRLLPGPAVAGPVRVPLIPHRLSVHRGWPAKKTKVLVVSDLTGDAVYMYDPTVPNPSPEGSITDGISSPTQVAFDRSETLYVSNIGNSTVTEYLAGQSSPNFTITAGLSSPYGVAVDSKGDVFVSNLGNNSITEYQPGQNTVYQTINLPSQQPVGLAEDSKDNLYIAVDTNNIVYEVASGSTTLKNLNLTGLSGPVGVSVGKKNSLWVGNFAGADVGVYASGATSPSYTITNGISDPTLNGHVKGGYFFQSNQDENCVGYKKKSTTPFSTITGLQDPLGVAGYPLGYK